MGCWGSRGPFVLTVIPCLAHHTIDNHPDFEVNSNIGIMLYPTIHSFAGAEEEDRGGSAREGEVSRVGLG